MEENKDLEYVEEEATAEEIALADQMGECLLKVWKLVGCFVAGWIAMMIGMTLIDYRVDQFAIGIVFFIGGVALMPLPSVMLLWGGAGFRELFDTDYFIETTYADGRKTVQFDGSMTFASKIATLAVAFLAGFIITPIRIVIGVISFQKAKKELGIEKLPIKEDVKFPFVVAILAFVAGCVLNLAVTNIAGAVLDKQMHTGDYTAEETLEIVEGWKNSMAEQSFSYRVNGSWLEEGNLCIIDVNYDRGVYAFTVSKANKGASDRVFTEADSPLPFGVYLYEDGEWSQNANSLSIDQKRLLKSCTLDAYFEAFTSRETILKNNLFMGEEGYRLMVYYDWNGEEKCMFWEVYKNGNRPYRINGYEGLGELYGSGDIMFD